MSFSLSRVPKKAALTALRGLIVGTSCGIALIVEDRRRRINCAQHVLRNADRIRTAAREYHTTSPSALGGLDDDQLPNGANNRDLVGWRKKNCSRARVSSRSFSSEDTAQKVLDEEAPSMIQADRTSTATKSAETDSAPLPHEQRGAVRPGWGNRILPGSTFLQPAPRIHTTGPEAADKSPKSHNSNIRLDVTDVMSEITAARVAEIVAEITAARIRMSGQIVDDALSLLQKALKPGSLSREHHTALVRAAAALSVDCQQFDLIDQAQRALLYVVEYGPLDESDYYAFNPLNIVKSAMTTVESTAAEGFDRNTATKRLQHALTLFLPRFTKIATKSSPEFIKAGERMLTLTLAYDQIDQAEQVFRRLLCFGDNMYKVTQYFIIKLCDKQEFKAAVKHFALYYTKMHPDRQSFSAVAEAVTKAIVTNHNHKAGHVLRGLIAVCPRRSTLTTTWVTNLLYGHWQRERDYEATRALYDELHSHGLSIMLHPDAAYRVMIQIALEAERQSAAESLLEQLLEMDPSQAVDARILGLFALAEAKEGKWDQVWEKFTAMKITDRIADTFVPVLKEYTRTHTVSETEDFLRVYIDELKVPVSLYMVNVVANKYGAIRDISSFVGWLEYCTKAGFEVDGSFTNAILVNCKRRWEFNFTDLRTVYRKLKLLSPQFTDHFTENVMIRAAISATRRGHKPSTRIGSLRISRSTRPHRSKVSTPDDVFSEMKMAMRAGEYALVRRIYKSAVYRSMPYSGRCLRLAVESALRTNRLHLQPVVFMLNEAQKKGNDITSAIIPLMSSRFKAIDSSMSKDEIAKAAGDMITNFESGGIIVPSEAFDGAASLCLRAKNYTAAISFALSSMKRRGAKRPDNVGSFILLLRAYSNLGDPEGLQWVVHSAFHGDFAHKHVVLDALKDAMGVLEKFIMTREVKTAIKIVEEGLNRAHELRDRLIKDRQTLQTEAVAVMQQAAVDAGQAPVDFTQVHYLPDAREKLRQEVREAMLAERAKNFELWTQQQQEGGTFDALEQALAEAALSPEQDHPAVQTFGEDFEAFEARLATVPRNPIRYVGARGKPKDGKKQQQQGKPVMDPFQDMMMTKDGNQTLKALF